MGIFEFEFMRKAFLVGILLGAIIPTIGVVVVFKRLSMIGDALSHTSLAGVTGGLILGINPVLGATITCIGAAFGIEAIRKKLPEYAEMSIAIIMSAGVGLAGVLSGFLPNSAGFNSFLFGSIVAISDFEMWMVIILSLFVAVSAVLFYKELCYTAFDENAAKLAGVPVGAVNFIFTLLTAITVSIASRTIGALMVSSLMVLPVACSMLVAKSYKQTMLSSVGFGVIFTVIGLCTAYYFGLKPGGTIVLSGVIVFILILAVKGLANIINKNSKEKQAQNL